MDKENSNNGIQEPEPLLCLVKFLHWSLLFCQKTYNQRYKNVGKKDLFSADEENLSSGIQNLKLLSYQVESLRQSSWSYEKIYD